MMRTSFQSIGPKRGRNQVVLQDNSANLNCDTSNL